MAPASLALGLLFLTSSVLAVPQTSPIALSPYAPTAAACPTTPLLRNGRTISAAEQDYATKRKAKADIALAAFNAKKGDFPVLDEYPMIGLANCGGGIRGFLTSAGMRMAYDARENQGFSTEGLLQAITYESALSGSSIMLGSYAVNNEETTLSLYNQIWKAGFKEGLFLPNGVGGAGAALLGITKDILAKQLAGSRISATDALGRLFGYVAYKPDSAGPAGVNKLLSGVLESSSFLNHEAPIPIFGALGLESNAEGCGLPPENATQYEFSPFEFGSFDKDVQAFTPTKYMGSTLNNGQPGKSLLGQSCITGFDNANFVIGTSTAVLNENCGKGGVDEVDNLLTKANLAVLEKILDPIAGLSQLPLFSFIPNFAFGSASSPKITTEKSLKLIDGGENIQVIPLAPFLFRDEVKVLIMTDSSTYGGGNMKVNIPNGRSLRNSFNQAKIQGAGNRFPQIPTPEVFIHQKLVNSTTVFGCNLAPEDPAMTMIYLPNRKITFNSAVKTNQNKYTPEESHGLLFNGAQVGTQGNDPEFGFCMSCFIMKRASEAESKALPKKCGNCFKRFCFN